MKFRLQVNSHITLLQKAKNVYQEKGLAVSCANTKIQLADM